MYPFTEVGAFGITSPDLNLTEITECEVGCKAAMLIPYEYGAVHDFKQNKTVNTLKVLLNLIFNFLGL